MALTLFQAETQVRALTRHDLDQRVTSAQIRIWLHHEYRALRTWLQDVAPSLYLVCSGEVDIGPGDKLQLSSSTATFERLYRVERQIADNMWRPLERSSEVDVHNHVAGRETFREEGGCLKFGPDDRFSGKVRVFFYGTPPTLTGDDDLFNVPVQLEHPLVLRTCGWVGVRDGDGEKTRKEFRDVATELLAEATPLLKRRHGVHPQSSGLRRVMGY